VPNISICIPAYKRTDFLKRLLDSIEEQTYKDYEVVVTDDSAAVEVENLCSLYSSKMQLRYFKNTTALGTPENWNSAIRLAEGKWIKIMHDDDWFYHKHSLQKFADAIKVSPGSNFIFAAYVNVYEDTLKEERVYMSKFQEKQMLKNPVTLIANNVIGPPSVVMHKNDKKHWYDKNVKWVVDMDFYIDFLQDAHPHYISEPLICVGVNKDQVTQYTFGVAEVQLKENFYLLNKVGENNLKNVIVFDGWWRLIRNFNVRDSEQIRRIGYDGPIPLLIMKVMSFQKKIPAAVLKRGLFSKALMMICYLINR
jgi:glycosyltransferase involved in cell wall biosynthesis